MSLINITNNVISSYPLWYFINDFLVIIINTIGICVAILFIYIIIRLDHPSYSISNLIACKTCLAIGLMSLASLLNNSYALASDFRGVGYNDSFCIIRGTIFSIFFVNMYTSLCLKAFNRLRCIVYRIRSVSKSYKSLLILILIQWLFVVILVLPIILTNGVDYDWSSHLCLVTIKKPWQFIFLMMIYYISILFISSAYFYILYYVVHLPLLEPYRRKRQLALLRRILILLCMLIIPGIFYFVLIIYWILFDSIPSYALKIRTFIDSIGQTGAVITVFISNTRLRHQFYIKQKKKLNQIQRANYELMLLQQQKRKTTMVQTSFTLERIPVNIVEIQTRNK